MMKRFLFLVVIFFFSFEISGQWTFNCLGTENYSKNGFSYLEFFPMSTPRYLDIPNEDDLICSANQLLRINKDSILWEIENTKFPIFIDTLPDRFIYCYRKFDANDVTELFLEEYSYGGGLISKKSIYRGHESETFKTEDEKIVVISKEDLDLFLFDYDGQLIQSHDFPSNFSLKFPSFLQTIDNEYFLISKTGKAVKFNDQSISNIVEVSTDSIHSVQTAASSNQIFLLTDQSIIQLDRELKEKNRTDFLATKLAKYQPFTIDKNGNLVIYGVRDSAHHIQVYDLDLNSIWEKNIKAQYQKYVESGSAIKSDNNGNIIVFTGRNWRDFRHECDFYEWEVLKINIENQIVLNVWGDQKASPVDYIYSGPDWTYTYVSESTIIGFFEYDDSGGSGVPTRYHGCTIVFEDVQPAPFVEYIFKAFIDKNKNCKYDIGEIPITNRDIEIFHSNAYETDSKELMTNASGLTQPVIWERRIGNVLKELFWVKYDALSPEFTFECLQITLDGPSNFDDTLVIELPFVSHLKDTLKGFVFEDKNGDCNFDASLEGLMGDQTIILENQSGDEIGQTQTDASGNFVFVYSQNVEIENARLLINEDSIFSCPIDLGNVDLKNIQIGVEKEHLIKGVVFWDTTKNCHLDQNEWLIPEVKIHLSNGVNFTKNITSGLDGVFQTVIRESQLSIGSWSYELSFNGKIYNDCSIDFNTLSTNDLQNFDLGIQSQELCPDLKISSQLVGGNWLRCEEIEFIIDYDNVGIGAVENAFIQLDIDDNLEFLNTEHIDYQLVGDDLRLSLGRVEWNESGSISINFKVPCDIDLSDKICLSAEIFPNTICGFGSDFSFLKCKNPSDKLLVEPHFFINEIPVNNLSKNNESDLLFVLKNNSLDTLTSWELVLSNINPQLDTFWIKFSEHPIKLDSSGNTIFVKKENLSIPPMGTDSISIQFKAASIYFQQSDIYHYSCYSIFDTKSNIELTSRNFDAQLNFTEDEWNYEPQVSFAQNGFISGEIDLSNSFELIIDFQNEIDFEIEDLLYRFNFQNGSGDILIENIEAPFIERTLVVGSEITIWFEDIFLQIDSSFKSTIRLNLSDFYSSDTKQIDILNLTSTSNESNFLKTNWNNHSLSTTYLTSTIDANPIKFSAYPNPSYDKIHFKLNNSSSRLFFELHNIAGQKVFFREVSGDFIIEKSEVGSGVFFFEMKESGVVVERGKVIFL